MAKKKLPLHIKILIGLLLGIIWAFVSSALGWNQFTIDWIDPFGVIFIRLLKFIAVPLVLFSIISGVSGLSDISRLGKLGAKTLGLYLITTVTAVGLGLLLVNIIQPGTHIDDAQRLKNRMEFEVWANTNNVVIQDGKSYLTDPEYAEIASQSADQGMINQLQEERESMVSKQMTTAEQKKESGPLTFLVDMVPENIILSISDNGLMLQVIFFAIFFGITLIMIPREKSEPVINLVHGLNDVFLKMVEIVMQAAPFFVFALLAGVIAKMADTPAQVFEIFKGLGSYSLVVLIGLLILIFLFYPVATW